eukprot:6021673-Pyramimonas_sp.AAC.1
MCSPGQVSVADGEGTAKFTAYKDRRIRAAFADRTLLELDAEWEMARARPWSRSRYVFYAR